MLRRVAQQLGGGRASRAQHQFQAAGGMGWTSSSSSALSSSEIALRNNNFSTSALVASSSSDPRPTEFAELRDTYTERRRLWRLELNAMRKVWAAEHAERLAIKAAREAEKRRIIELEKAERRRIKEIRKAEKAIVHNAKVERERREREQWAVITAQRRAQKEFVEHLRRTAREEELLNDSRNWVTREDLDAQIEYALSNPVRMW